MDLVYGAGRIDRLVPGIDALLSGWRKRERDLGELYLLHKKRPTLIPLLDNQAIFGAYMNPRWPGKPSSTDTVKDVPRIKEALDWIARDLVRPENEAAGCHLEALEAGRSRIELFDMIWWTYFRQVEPYAQPDSSLGLRKVSRPRSAQAIDRRIGANHNQPARAARPAQMDRFCSPGPRADVSHHGR